MTVESTPTKLVRAGRLLCLVLLLAASAAVLWAGRRAATQVLAAQQSRMEASVRLRGAGLTADIASLRRDALFLAGVPPVPAIAAALADGGAADPRGAALAQGRAGLHTILAGFFEANPELRQARLIGIEGGRELVRVERRGEKVEVVPQNRLQQGIDSDYFRAAAALAPGQVHVSDLNLQREFGHIAQPHRRVVRAATPVYGPNGKLFGVMVLNLGLDAALTRLRDNLASDFRLYLLNGGGHYLLQPDPARSFGFDEGRRWRWQDEHDAPAGGAVSRGPAGREYTRASRVSLDPAQPERDLTLIVALPEAALAPAVAEARLGALLVTLSCGALGAAAFLLYRHMHRRAERQRAELAAIVASSHDAIIGKTLEGVVTSWNRGAERVFGYSAQQACGRPLAELIVPEANLSEESGILERVGRGEVVSNYETVRRRRDGGLVYVSVTISPIRAASGAVVGAAKTVRDISAQKASALQILELNKSLECQVAERTAQIRDLGALHQAILDQAGYAIIASDTSGVVTLFNPAAEHLLGYTAQQVIGHITPERFHDPAEVIERAAVFSATLGRTIPPGFDVFIAKALHGLPNEHEWTFICRDGSRVPVLLSVTALTREDGAVFGYLGMAADLSERRAAQQALEARTREAEAANRAKSDFLANMSHEIRTPINAVLGMLQLLGMSGLQPRQAGYAAKADAAARALLGIINNILDYSRVEAGKLSLEQLPFSLDKLFSDVAVILAANLGGKRLELLCEIDPALPDWIVADPLRLQQVLINLAGNAVKFTERGEVALTCKMTAAAPLTLAFSVRDTGIGIAAAHHDGIFEGFSQAEASTARRYGGSGLGLTISRRLVDLMGGCLRLASAAGQGSVFSFEIVCEAAAPQPRRRTPDPALGNLRCLVVEQHEGTRRILAGLLSGFGWQIDQAADAGQASELLADGTAHDLLLLDWDMQGMDGAALCGKLRQGAKAPAVLALLGGAGAQPALEPACQPDAVLVKPVTASSLLDSIEAWRGGPAPHRHGDTGQRLAGLRLLLVEDNPFNQEVGLELLSHEGAEVTLAASGQAALTLLDTAQPAYDAVLMDVQMPDMDGYAATRAIRARPGAARLPIIAVTANAMASDRAAALAAGMDEHIGKPFDLGHLSAVIRHLSGAGPAPAPLTPRMADDDDQRGMSGAIGFNAAAALARCGGALDLYCAISLRFPAEIAQLAARLRLSRAQPGTQETLALLHQIKGAAGMVGAERLARLARHAERCLVHAGDERARDAVEAVLLEVAPAGAAARQAAAQTGAAPPEPCQSGQGHADAASAAAALTGLMPLLGSANLDALAYAGRLRTQRPPTLARAFDALAEAIDALQFTAALEQCAALLPLLKENADDA